MSWRVAASLLTLRDQVDAAAPGRSRRSDGTIGDASHRSRRSDHNPWVPPPHGGVVTALDLTHDPAAGASMHALAETLRTSRDPRIKYVIWNRRIFSSTISPWTWRAFNGSNPHTSHLHLSVNSAAHHFDSTRPWTLPAYWQNVTPTTTERAIVEALVRGIQESLVAAGHDPGPVDGRWGPRTQAALVKALKSDGTGLTPDASQWLQAFADARPSDARSTSLWHVLREYRARRRFFKTAP